MQRLALILFALATMLPGLPGAPVTFTDRAAFLARRPQ